MTSHQVTCITLNQSTDPQERITHLGGHDPRGRVWRLTMNEVITGIIGGKWSFFIEVDGAPQNLVVASSRRGFRFLRAEVDSEEPLTLLRLPECGG